MTPQALIALLIWPLIVLFLFAQLPNRTFVLTAFIGAWLFLPEKVGFVLPGLPDYYKMSATCYSIFLAILLFDSKIFRSYKFSWLDIPIIIWCISPCLSSLSNGLGLYDGISSSLNSTMAEGVPYIFGRLYFGSFGGLRKIALGIFWGGLIYVPLCLLESRISPQLHRMVYGFHQIEFGKSYRLGGFRPTVFMSHGLTVGMWMMAVALIAIWIWQSKTLKRVGPIPMNLIVVVLVITFILVRSTGAYLYLLMGVTIMVGAKWLRNSILMIALIGMITLYLLMGITGSFNMETQGSRIVNFAASVAGPDRAQSLEFRFENEEILVEKARQRIIFGWGGWGRSRVYNEYGEDISTTDSLWIITLGQQGVVGLFAIFAVALVPVALLTIKYPPRHWFHPTLGPAMALAVVVTLYMVDCLLNYKPNPVFILSCGALTGLLSTKQSTRSQLSYRKPKLN